MLRGGGQAQLHFAVPYPPNDRSPMHAPTSHTFRTAGQHAQYNCDWQASAAYSPGPTPT